MRVDIFLVVGSCLGQPIKRTFSTTPRSTYEFVHDSKRGGST